MYHQILINYTKKVYGTPLGEYVLSGALERDVFIKIIKNDSETKWLPEIERPEEISMTANIKTIVLRFWKLRRFAWENGKLFHQASFNFLTHVLSNHHQVLHSNINGLKIDSITNFHHTLSSSGVQFVPRRGHVIVTLSSTQRAWNPFTGN